MERLLRPARKRHGIGCRLGKQDLAEANMQAITTIGLDIAKSVFQIHGVDGEGKIALRRQVKRSQVLGFFRKLQPCFVGIEACASSHYWSRELQALGHMVRLMPPAYVKPYLKRQKNDAADAEAIPAFAGTSLRGRAATEHAVRSDENSRPAGVPDTAPDTAPIHPPTDGCHQRDPRASGGVRHCRAGGSRRHG